MVFQVFSSAFPIFPRGFPGHVSSDLTPGFDPSKLSAARTLRDLDGPLCGGKFSHRFLFQLGKMNENDDNMSLVGNIWENMGKKLGGFIFRSH